MAPKSSGFSTLGDLLRQQGFEASPEVDKPAETLPDPGLDLSAKLVVRRERKGRGGKTVTTVSGLAGSPAAIDQLLRTWKKELGRGARKEGDLILVQGDCVAQLRERLTRLGAKQIRGDSS